MSIRPYASAALISGTVSDPSAKRIVPSAGVRAGSSTASRKVCRPNASFVRSSNTASGSALSGFSSGT